MKSDTPLIRSNDEKDFFLKEKFLGYVTGLSTKYEIVRS